MLGIAETMFGPGVALYFSYFYPRQYMGLRFGLFLSGAALANAYGGALAYALSHIHSGISNWKILFILEGVPTVILAVVAWFYIPDSPATAKFLNERERYVAVNLAAGTQVNQEGEPGKRGINASNLLDAFKDHKSMPSISHIETLLTRSRLAFWTHVLQCERLLCFVTALPSDNYQRLWYIQFFDLEWSVCSSLFPQFPPHYRGLHLLR